MVAANGDAGAMLARVQVFAVGLVLVYLASYAVRRETELRLEP